MGCASRIGETDISKAKAARQLLKTAGLVFLTDGAVAAVGGEQQLQNHFRWCCSLGVLVRMTILSLGGVEQEAIRLPRSSLHHAHTAGASIWKEISE